MNFKVIFYLDGTGIYYDPYEPIHLDALLAWALAPMQFQIRDLQQEDIPDDIQIPLWRSNINGSKIWHGSALFAENEDIKETIRYCRKRFRQNRIELTNGSINLTGGAYKERNMSLPLLLIPRLIAYARGNPKEVRKILTKHISALGRRRSAGYGRITHIECEIIENDWSLVKDNIAMRWLPDANGFQERRVVPPYWVSIGRVRSCEVGDEMGGIT